MSKIQAKLPPVYHSFFPDFQSWQVPDEEIATCHDCTMCRRPKSPFLNTKCCTYFPYLPNYLVGGILQDTRIELQEGKKRISERIQNALGIVPYGVIQSTQYADLSKKLRKKKEKSWKSSEAEALLCPYYDGGNCTIWDYRENCCSTHFCYSVGGNDGQSFWRKLNQYLVFTENELSKYALLQLGFPIEKISIERKKIIDYQIEDSAGKINHEKYNELWGDWAGKEAELYIESYKIIKNLSKEEFLRIGGTNQEIFLKQLEFTHQQFTNPKIPDFLKLNEKVKIKQINANKKEYSTDLGMVEIEGVLLKFIELFDGTRKTDEICSMIAPFIPNFKEEYLKKFYQIQILMVGESTLT
jgi:Fe-S-cluster containining protein